MAKRNKLTKVLSIALGIIIFLSTTMLTLKIFAPSIFCDHDFQDGVCIECDYECEHADYDDGACVDCGEPEPADDEQTEA